MEHPAGHHCSVCGLIPLVPRLKGATHIVVQSHEMQVVLKRVARFAPSDAPVAILGETGTGKEVIARLLHINSPRAAQPFVAVNVAALPADLLESELFGHGKGAFTGAATARRGLFECADKGTLFLDEIGEMPLPLQAKLLRVLQDGEIRRVGENHAFSVDVRILCATHRDLSVCVREGRFREDLFYRLKVLMIEVPPLRLRKADIVPLATRFLEDERANAHTFSMDAIELLHEYAWPGNVRELQNAIRHGAALATGSEIEGHDLPIELQRAVLPSVAPPIAEEPLPVAQAKDASKPHIAPEDLKSLAEVEREHILRVLDACNGSPSEAARILGIARNTLWRKLRELT